METLDALSALLEAEADNLEYLYQRCVRLVIAEDYEAALTDGLTILQRDREFRDDIGRLTMIRIFAVLGKGHPLAGQYRRKMFNFLH
ncbi:MAG: tetratricopeptide repeat protein [Pseudomonadota bacterium]